MPKIFGVIDTKMRETLVGERTERLAPQLPGGFVRFGERWVESKPIKLPDRTTSFYIRGKLDAILAFDGGSFGVVDFKTSKPGPSHAEIYFRQLNAYAYSLQHAAIGKFSLEPITRLGLLVFEPELFIHNGSGSATMAGALSWIEVRQDRERFLAYLSDVLKTLEKINPPQAAPTCEWCKYREGGALSKM